MESENVNVRSQRKRLPTKVISISNVVNQTSGTQLAPSQRLKQKELDKLQKLKNQIEAVKDKVQTTVVYDQLSKRRLKYKLNVDTDSEDETSNYPKGSPADLLENKGIDAQIKNRAELAKAKQNANALFGEDGGSTSIENLQSNLMRTTYFGSEQNCGTIQSQQFLAGKEGIQIIQQNTLSNNNARRPSKYGTGINYYQQGSVLSNSFLEEPDEEICFLRGLSQNQNLEQNCELIENVEDDRINISIKTTDFFTFIRLQDEVDELRRKNNDFQFHKQIIEENQTQKQHKAKLAESDHKHPHTNALAARLLGMRNNPSMFAQTAADPDVLKKDAQNLFAICRVMKFCRVLKNKAAESQQLKKKGSTESEPVQDQSRSSKDSNSSCSSSSYEKSLDEKISNKKQKS